MMTLNITNSTHYYGDPSPSSVEIVVGLVVFYSIVSFIAIVSNVLILLTVIRRLVPKNTVNVFLASLAASDLMLVMLSIFDGVSFIVGGWKTGEWSCKLQSLFLEVSFAVSTLTLVAVSCERYLSICYPHMKKRSIKATCMMIVFVWLLAIVICSPLLHGYVVYFHLDHVARTKELVCANIGWPDKYRIIYYYTYSIIVYFIPLVVMVWAHWRISKNIHDTARRPSLIPIQSEGKKMQSVNVCSTIQEEDSGISAGEMPTNESETPKPKCSPTNRGFLTSVSTLSRKLRREADRDYNRREKRIRVIKILFVVTITFFVLWTPFIFMRLIMLAGIDVNEYIYKFSEVLLLSSTAVNGFIYAFMSPSFRKAFKMICVCRSTKAEYSLSTGPSLSSDEPQARRMGARASISSNGTGTLPFGRNGQVSMYIPVQSSISNGSSNGSSNGCGKKLTFDADTKACL